MQHLRLVASVILAVAASGCTQADRLGRAIDQPRFVPKTDRQLEHELGVFPTPGPSATSFDSVPAGLEYAREVVSYDVGSPPPVPEGQHPEFALGPPDYEADIHKLPRMVSLGNGGSIVLGFGGPGLGDAAGPDLYLWEIGPSVEAVSVSISDDGERWIAAGELRGGSSSLDIAPVVHVGDSFHFVRLKDVPFQGAESDAWPGADIDAVGVRAGEVKRTTLSSEVLFAFDSDVLDPAAGPLLEALVADLRATPGARIAIEGHTDDIGADDYNQKLSERRAEAVATYLASKGIGRGTIETRGLGESKPVAPNDTDDNRKKNRRVEIVVQQR